MTELKATLYENTFRTLAASAARTGTFLGGESLFQRVFYRAKGNDRLHLTALLVFDEVNVFNAAPLHEQHRREIAVQAIDQVFGLNSPSLHPLSVLVETVVSTESRHIVFERVVDGDPEVLSAIDAMYDAAIPLNHASAAGRLLLSVDPVISAAYAQSASALSPAGIAAVLAMAGLELALPRFEFEGENFLDRSNYVQHIRQKYNSEHLAYVDSLRAYVGECHRYLVAGEYKNAWDFAEYETNQRLLPRLHSLEAAVAGSDRRLKSSVAAGLAKGIPGLFQAAIAPAAWPSVGFNLLKILIDPLIGRQNARKEFRDVSYLYTIKELGRS